MATTATPQMSYSSQPTPINKVRMAKDVLCLGEHEIEKSSTALNNKEHLLETNPAGSYQFNRQAIRSNYMDKSIEAKKKVRFPFTLHLCAGGNEEKWEFWFNREAYMFIWRCVPSSGARLELSQRRYYLYRKKTPNTKISKLLKPKLPRIKTPLEIFTTQTSYSFKKETPKSFVYFLKIFLLLAVGKPNFEGFSRIFPF